MLHLETNLCLFLFHNAYKDINTKVISNTGRNPFAGKITEGWLLTSTPYPVIATVALYLLFVLRVGPRLMIHKSPYRLMNLMRLYNIFQVLYNLHVLQQSVSKDNIFKIYL